MILYQKVLCDKKNLDWYNIYQAFFFVDGQIFLNLFSSIIWI
jgi:hypothetical protein